MRSLTGAIRACSADAQLAVEMEGSGFNAWARALLHQIGPRILLMVAACTIARLTGLHVFSAGLCRCDASVGCYDAHVLDEAHIYFMYELSPHTVYEVHT